MEPRKTPQSNNTALRRPGLHPSARRFTCQGPAPRGIVEVIQKRTVISTMTAPAPSIRAPMALLLVLAGVSCHHPNETALWPGAAYTHQQRNRVVHQGLEFINRSAQAHFETYASDYLWCFYTVAASAADTDLAEQAQSYGRELALRWRKTHRNVPKNLDADSVVELVMAHVASEDLGVPDSSMQVELATAVSRFGAVDFLGFEPRIEPPPAYKATSRLVQGRNVDVPPYNFDTLYDALITAYFGDRFGLALGAPRRSVVRWLKALHPYRLRDTLGDTLFYDQLYLVTHVVYTANDYGQLRLKPQDLPAEHRFLNQALPLVLADGDGESLAEIIDTLRAFGHTPAAGNLMGRAMELLLSQQNDDGSFGHSDDVYDRYHTTWTAIDALKTYRYELSPRLGESLSRHPK